MLYHIIFSNNCFVSYEILSTGPKSTNKCQIIIQIYVITVYHARFYSQCPLDARLLCQNNEIMQQLRPNVRGTQFYNPRKDYLHFTFSFVTFFLLILEELYFNVISMKFSKKYLKNHLNRTKFSAGTAAPRVGLQMRVG